MSVTMFIRNTSYASVIIPTDTTNILITSFIPIVVFFLCFVLRLCDCFVLKFGKVCVYRTLVNAVRLNTKNFDFTFFMKKIFVRLLFYVLKIEHRPTEENLTILLIFFFFFVLFASILFYSSSFFVQKIFGPKEKINERKPSNDWKKKKREKKIEKKSLFFVFYQSICFFLLRSSFIITDSNH